MADLFESYEVFIPKPVLDRAKTLTKQYKLSEKDTKLVLDKIKTTYEDMKIAPGEAIGIVTAESFGEPGTQMILRSFHFAGASEMKVTMGLPRLIEIFDARKNPSTPVMEVYLQKKYSQSPTQVKEIAARIKETKLEEVASEFLLNIIENNVEVKLARKKMTEFNLSSKDIADIIVANLKNVTVDQDRDSLIIKSTIKEIKLSELYKLKEKSKEIHISGVKGIARVLPMKVEEEYIIYCVGSNLKDMLEIEEIDATRTRTNDVAEIGDVLGVEAARQAIVDEILKVIGEQGLNIDIRHIMLLADAMTATGEIKGVTRSGITQEKESVLAKASFETPIPHLVDASLTGEVDQLSSVIENVMLNQPVPLGTGLPGLMAKMKPKVEK
ncbi:MAG: DNA-directed RNA polymerase subunit A'' [Candidatus Nanoarchaeia archaeon]